ncbi:MAG: hypothetical protein MPJ50_04455, partial [Pirellulales bacterium]|nr:hypothetical protein [Pirellulales bacterium]
RTTAQRRALLDKPAVAPGEVTVIVGKTITNCTLSRCDVTPEEGYSSGALNPKAMDPIRVNRETSELWSAGLRCVKPSLLR